MRRSKNIKILNRNFEREAKINPNKIIVLILKIDTVHNSNEPLLVQIEFQLNSKIVLINYPIFANFEKQNLSQSINGEAFFYCLLRNALEKKSEENSRKQFINTIKNFVEVD